MPIFDNIAALLSSPARPPARSRSSRTSVPSTPTRNRTQNTPRVTPTRMPTTQRTNLFSPALDPTNINPLAQDISHAISKSFAPSTISNYTGAVNAFLAWCDTRDILTPERFPASEFILCAFIASFTGIKAGTSASSTLAGLRTWHIAGGAPWNESPRLTLVTRGVSASTPATSIRPPRDPITPTMLTDLSSHLHPNDPADIAILAAAFVAFWGQCRLGELLGTSKLRHDPSKFPSRTSIGPSISRDGSCELRLPSTKTKRTKGESVVITAQLPPTDPVAAIRRHLAFDTSIPPSAHIFAYRPRNRPQDIHALTKETFLDRVNDIWVNLGHPRFSGHSFRIGGTSSLLHAGVAPEVVRSMGRWASDAHFRYWRNTSSLAVDHAENLSADKLASSSRARPASRTAPARRTTGLSAARGRPY